MPTKKLHPASTHAAGAIVLILAAVASLAIAKARGLEAKDRVFWISELKAGRSPFDQATLKSLLKP